MSYLFYILYIIIHKNYIIIMKKKQDLNVNEIYQNFALKLRKTEIDLKCLQRTLRPLFKSRIFGNSITITSKITKKSLKITFDLIADYSMINSGGFVFELFTPDTKTLFNKLLKHNLI